MPAAPRRVPARTHFPAGKTHANIKQACAETPFPTDAGPTTSESVRLVYYRSAPGKESSAKGPMHSP
ncbi:hypothetical protein C8Q80DRAFT_1180927 [Daedaleopsis nitida]|nr:hypothetical protein C8Q80DRAFT_1180927 [Daedaleopsis nitida]